ncbi:hypothetical protein D5S17_35765 [Pseudonocardiaceae bacterium YIM PH 21723]|nr:hypothetical protein D5S17_35765 [Pseudonocardiaceae bacterium YIM PH 21723]
MTQAEALRRASEQSAPGTSTWHAEKGVIGAVLRRPERLDAFASWLAPEDFFDPEHQGVYATLLGLHANDELYRLNRTSGGERGMQDAAAQNLRIVRSALEDKRFTEVEYRSPFTVVNNLFGAGTDAPGLAERYGRMVAEMSDSRQLDDLGVRLEQAVLAMPVESNDLTAVRGTKELVMAKLSELANGRGHLWKNGITPTPIRPGVPFAQLDESGEESPAPLVAAEGAEPATGDPLFTELLETRVRYENLTRLERAHYANNNQMLRIAQSAEQTEQTNHTLRIGDGTVQLTEEQAADLREDSQQLNRQIITARQEHRPLFPRYAELVAVEGRLMDLTAQLDGQTVGTMVGALVERSERRVIQAVLTDTDLQASDLLHNLQPEDFASRAHGNTWLAIQMAAETGRPFDAIMVAKECERLVQIAETKEGYRSPGTEMLATKELIDLGQEPARNPERVVAAVKTVAKASLGRLAVETREAISKMAADRAAGITKLIGDTGMAAHELLDNAERLIDAGQNLQSSGVTGRLDDRAPVTPVPQPPNRPLGR